MGVCFLAATSGINLVGKLPQEKLDKVRDLLPQMGQKQESIRTRTRSKQPIQKSITISVGETFVVHDPILPEKVIGEARLMAEEDLSSGIACPEEFDPRVDLADDAQVWRQLVGFEGVQTGSR